MGLCYDTDTSSHTTPHPLCYYMFIKGSERIFAVMNEDPDANMDSMI